MDSLLFTIIRAILPDSNDTELHEVVRAIKEAGIRSESDLQYVVESDISQVLPRIQARKLIQNLQLKYGTFPHVFCVIQK
jgi:hypothetical protein